MNPFLSSPQNGHYATMSSDEDFGNPLRALSGEREGVAALATEKFDGLLEPHSPPTANPRRPSHSLNPFLSGHRAQSNDAGFSTLTSGDTANDAPTPPSDAYPTDSLLAGGDRYDVPPPPRAPVPFCCLPGNPKVIFRLFMTLIILSFLVVPLTCNAALDPPNMYVTRTLPNALRNHVSWYEATFCLDELVYTMSLYAYFGNYLPQLNSTNTATTDPTTQIMGIITRMKESMAVAISVGGDDTASHAAPIYSALEGFTDTVFPTFAVRVNAHVASMRAMKTLRTTRSLIARLFLTLEAQATISLVGTLMQEAKLSCYMLDTCWEGDGREMLDQVETYVGGIANAAMTTIVEVFSLIEDPRMGATDIEELITENVKNSAARLRLLSKGSEWLLALESLLEPYSTPPTDGVLDAFYFSLPPDWISRMRESLLFTLKTAEDINQFYEKRSPVPDWMRDGGEEVLSSGAELDLLSSAGLYDSVFALKMGENLSLTLSVAEQEEAMTNFLTGEVTTFLRRVEQLLSEQVQRTQEEFVQTTLISKKAMVREVNMKVELSLIISAVISFALHGVMLYILRYRLQDAPLSFVRLVLIVLLCYVAQLAMGISMVVVAKQVPVSEQEFSLDFLKSIAQSFSFTRDASRIMSRGLRLMLLIEPSEQIATLHLLGIRDSYSLLAKQTPNVTWISPLGNFVQNVEDLLAGGFDPLRQQLSSSSAVRLTGNALNEVFGFPTVKAIADGAEIKLVAKPCYGSLISAAMSSLAFTFMGVSFISDAIYSKQTADTAAARGSYVHGALEVACFNAALVASEDENQADCYSAPICDYPSAYGLLRTLDSSASVYSLFDPAEEDSLGVALVLWRSLSFEYLPSEIQSLVDRLDNAIKADAITVARHRRYIVWSGIFTCVGLQFLALVLYHQLFGANVRGLLL